MGYRWIAVIMLALVCVACESDDVLDVASFGDSDADAAITGEPVANTGDGSGTTAASDGAAESLPFSWSDVVVCSGDANPGGWARTVTLNGASFSGNGNISWSYAGGAPGWPSTGSINKNPNAVLGFVTQIGGTWCMAIGEWIPPGGTLQTSETFRSVRGGKTFFSGPLANHSLEKGRTYYMFVCGLNWSGQKNVQERSNAVAATF